MNNLAFFFEIGDKIISNQKLYALMIVLGGIGVMLGYIRWWLGLIWLIIPVSIISFYIFDIRDLYDDMVKEFGKNYILHSYISFVVAILLNLFGIILGLVKSFNTKKLNLS